MKIAETKILRWICGVIRMDKIKNQFIRGSLSVMNITGKLERIYRDDYYILYIICLYYLYV